MFLDLRHLRTLAMLRETGSLAQAAEHLHLTQSALSHQLKALEDYFGLSLFVRKSRPVRFTPAGERLVRLAERVLPDVTTTERDLARLAGGEAGRLHIAMECHSCFDWLVPTLDHFREHWPEVELDILMGLSFQGLEVLNRGAADLIVTSDPVDDPAIHYAPLFRYHGVLALAKNHPLTAREWIEPPDLRDQTLIVYPVGREKLDVFKHFLDPAGVEPAALRATELTVMIMQLVASGRGVAALPNWVLGEYLARDYVAARRLGREPFWCTLYAATRAEDAALPFMRDFVTTARAVAHRVLEGIRPAPAGNGG